jgi:energy-coupling factor transport system permease protein
MTLIPAYRSRPSALHSARATIGAGFCASFALVGALYRNPLILAGALGGIVLAGTAAGVGREVGRSLRLALPFALLVALVNALVYDEGNTLLLRGDHFLGRRWDITLEATAEGFMNGMRIVVLVAALGGLMSAAVDPDELLKALRRLSYRSALTAALATRLVPVLARDAARMGDAARCRPQPPGRLAVSRAALAGALDRAVDVAATLEVRGYGARTAVRPAAEPWSRHDVAFAASAVVLVALAVGAGLAGVAAFAAYPSLHAPAGPDEVALAALIVVVALAPFLDRRGIER